MLRRLSLAVVGMLVAGVVTAAPALAAAPTVTAFTPTSGPISTLVTVTGSGFTGATTVTFAGVASRTVQVVSATSLTARVPLTGSGPVRVSTADGTATAGTFTVTPGVLLAPVVVRPTGTTTVSVSGFAAREAVDVYLDTVGTALVVAGAAGTLTTTVTVPPATTPGQHWVTAVGRRSGNAAQAALTVRTDWASSSFDAGHTGLNPYETQVTAATVDGLRERWRTVYGAPVNAPPVVAGGLVFLHTTNDDVVAVTAATGVQKWRVDLSTGGNANAPPVVAGGVVYVGGSDGYLYALTATTGAQKWRYNTGGPVSEAAVVAAGTVYVPSRGGAFYALDAATGALRWGTSFPGGGGFPLSPTVVGPWLYVGASDGSMRRMDAASGGTGWVVGVGGTPFAAPVVADGKVFVPTLAGTIVALGAGSGSILWSATVGGGSVTGTPALVGSRLIVTNTAAVVTAYEYTSGAVLWSQTGVANAGYSQVAAAGGIAYVADAERTRAYDLRTGALLRTLALGANSPGVVVSDGALYGYDYTDRALIRYDLGAGGDAARPAPAGLTPDRSRVAP